MKSRLSQTARDMLLSIGAVIALVALVALFTYKPADEKIRVVDYQPTVAAARSTGAFDVAVPTGEAKDWKATSVRYVPSAADPTIATWHLGFITPTNQYAALEQTNGTDPNFIKESTAKGQPDGEQVIDGQKWLRYYSSDTGHRSLVSSEKGITTIVTGTLTYDELATMATSLRTS
ncbi:MAG: DUF4245 domain-containing protein [Candidatus Nanopelagicales bacterium]